MPPKKRSIAEHKSFTDTAALFGSIEADSAAALAMSAGDLVLVLDSDGKVIDGSADLQAIPEVPGWVSKNWRDIVTPESQNKIDAMLEAARSGDAMHPRQVNLVGPNGDIPVSFVLVDLGGGKGHLAIGRDLREAAALQQRLLQAQQSLERDYLRLRQLETRYRLLFDMSGEPVMIIDHENRRIVEANPAAHAILNAKPGTLVGAKFLSLFHRGAREDLIGFLGGAISASKVSPLNVRLADDEEELWLTANGFRQRGKLYALVRLDAGEIPTNDETSATLGIVESMPDAFVLTDEDWSIVTANIAFAEMIGAASIDQVRGRRLGEFVGRPGIDLELIQNQLVKQGFARNVSSVIGAGEGSEGEPIELSAVVTGEDNAHYGLVIRPTARRLRDLPPTPRDMPRSVEQLTELVGRMSLKDIVRESTDLIERLCIEAALAHTSDNRASAAEILGLSRQSLYSKLHRYNLGNLVSEPD